MKYTTKQIQKKINVSIKEVVFFDFAPLNYGGGCEKNFMKYGSWLQNRNYQVSYITPSIKLSSLMSCLPFISKYQLNIENEALVKDYGVKNYVTFDLVDVFFQTEKRKEIRELFSNSKSVISKNEIFDIFLLKLLSAPFEKIVFGFHTPLFYPVAKSIKAKVHNLIYSSRWYFSMLKTSRVRCLVLTSFEEQHLAKHGVKSVVTVPNPVDSVKYSEKKYLKGNIFKVYYIGRMTEQKGVEIIVNIVEFLSTHNSFGKFEFHFIGSGELSHLLVNLSLKYKNCFFEGFKINIVECLHNADLVLVPSRWESFCYAVAEAQSCGVPVIASNITGPRDIIINTETGWLAEVDSTADFCEKIIHCFDLWQYNYDSLSQMGMRGRENIINRYSEAVINQKITDYVFKDH